MVGARGDWWLGHDGRWRQGLPPPGWRRARDRTWYPADQMPTDDEATSASGGTYGAPTVEMHHAAPGEGDAAYGAHRSPPAHLGGGGRDGPESPRPPDVRGWLPPFRSWPVWVRVGAPVAAALAALAGLLVVSEMFRDHDHTHASAFGRLGPSASTPLALDTGSATTSTSTSTTTTTTPEPTTTTEPPTTHSPTPPAPPDAGVRYRNCNQARAAGDAPLLPGDPGYDPALDSNGNGVACDGADAPHRGPP